MAYLEDSSERPLAHDCKDLKIIEAARWLLSLARPQI